jgi:hypothetical protein
MKKHPGLIIGIAAGLLLACSFGDAKAEHTSRYKGQVAGTFLGTRIDLNHDGVAASWSTQEVSGTLGKRTIQVVSESVPTGPTSECPGGVNIVDAPNEIGFGTATSTFPNGDQLYSQLLTRTQCVLGGGKSTASDTWTIIGGTGKFDGASGTYEQHVTVLIQVVDLDANPHQPFGSVSGEFEGTITLP